VLLARLSARSAAAVRLVALALITWSVAGSSNHPGTTGRGLVVSVALAAAALGWLAWTARPTGGRVTPEMYLTAAAGGLLTGADPGSAASALVFVAVIAAGLRVELRAAIPVAVTALIALALSDLAYGISALSLLAYALGFALAAVGASNSRHSVARAEQAELLLAQAQRSHEEQLRAARLEEAARLAREIHDVLAHSLAGLAIQLEATGALVERGAERAEVLARLRRAHALAREGLRETRLAVGALRGEDVSAPAAIEALVDEFRAAGDSEVALEIAGDRARLSGEVGRTVLRVVQESLTNVRKHAPGAAVSVSVQAGARPGDRLLVRVDDRPGAVLCPPGPDALSAAGGGYGLRGMRERAQALGGRLVAGPHEGGWRVELSLPGESQGAAAPDALVGDRAPVPGPDVLVDHGASLTACDAAIGPDAERVWP